MPIWEYVYIQIFAFFYPLIIESIDAKGMAITKAKAKKQILAELFI